MQDLRLAIRTIRATPVVSFVAVASLALGIGANTAIFSLVNSLGLRALPVRQPERLAFLYSGRGGWTYSIWDQIQQRPRLFDSAFAWNAPQLTLGRDGEAEVVNGIWASGGFFEALGIPAILGRTFTATDDQRGGGPDGPVAVISYAFWQRRFGGAANAIGASLMVERVPFTIIGVTPPGFFGPSVGRAFDVAVPLQCDAIVRGRETRLDQRDNWWLEIIVRLKPDQSLEQGTAALRAIQPQIRQATPPENATRQVLARHLREPFELRPAAAGDPLIWQRYQKPLLTLMVVVALVLLIACANIANLLLARAAARRHELSVRRALGASRWHLARQLLMESVVLSGIGAALSLMLARWGSDLLVRQLSTQTNPLFVDLSIDWRVLTFTAGITLITALLFGTAPAFRGADAAPMETLKSHERTTPDDRPGGVASGVVVAQVALSLVLVVGAGLFIRTFVALTDLNLGLEPGRVLVVSINAQSSRTPVPDRPALYERIREALQIIPGVAGAAASFVTPAGGANWTTDVVVLGTAPLPDRDRQTSVNIISPDWFATFGTPLIEGHDFTPHDRAGTAPIAIVNQAFVRRFLLGGRPLGRLIRLQGSLANETEPPREIVGVAADAVYRSLRAPVPPTVYLPLRQSPGLPMMRMGIRSASGSPAMLARSAAVAIRGVDRDLAVTFRPLAEQLNASLAQERVIAMLSGFFGALALLLAGLGLYGMTSYAVTRRRSEIGIRMALGAPPGGLVRLVLSRALRLVGGGVLVGAGLSLWASRFVASLLYGLEPRDPVTLTGAAAILVAVAVIAGWLPASRASRIDPAVVLRER